jgi:hypothetical protein
MTARALLALSIAMAAVSAGCTYKYIYGPLGPTRPAKPADCRYEVLSSVPSRAFEEIGVLAPQDIEYGRMAGGDVPFKESVTAQVCAAGGDAVVVERDYFSNIVRGTVIAWK